MPFGNQCCPTSLQIPSRWLDLFEMAFKASQDRFCNWRFIQPCVTWITDLETHDLLRTQRNLFGLFDRQDGAIVGVNCQKIGPLVKKPCPRNYDVNAKRAGEVLQLSLWIRMQFVNFSESLQVISTGEVRDQRPKLSSKHGIAEECFTQFKILVDHLLAIFRVMNHALNLSHNVTG